MSVDDQTISSVRPQRRGGVAILTLDTPGRSMNVVDSVLLDDLALAFEAALDDREVTAVVLASGKEGSFGAGADVDWLPALAARDDVHEFLGRVHDLMCRMADSSKPVVSAVDGAAFGGALEIALAGEAIVATPRARLGLVEITLGLIPGGGGTQLIHRWVEPGTAIDLLVSGRALDATEALRVGLVDEMSTPEALLETAMRLARTRTRATRRSWPSVEDAVAEDALAAGRAVRRVASESARDAVLTVIDTGLREGPEAGLSAERDAFVRLLRSRESQALRHLFTVESAIKKASPAAGADVDRIGVVGAGQMGAGIAATAISRGLSAVLRDIDPVRLDEASARAAKALSRVSAGAEPDPDRWSGTTGWDRFIEADAVVEAVFELPELKRETLARLGEQVRGDTLVATNTSAIPVASLADAVPDPTRFLGTHFFSPVELMPLVELVPHAGTSPATLARAAAFARRLGKIPVVVADYPGFFTSRVYARWLIEALRLLLDGVDPEQVDHEAKQIGFPVGPLQAHDEATLELVKQASVTQVAEQVMAERLDVPAVKALLGRLIDAGVVGKRAGRGFYAYIDGRRSGIDPQIATLVGATGPGVPDGVAGERLLLAFVTECLLCWDDATLCHPDDGDVASILGIGFPRALGGPFHWTDLEGPAGVLARCEKLGTRAFPPGEALPRLAAAGGTFGGEARLARPGRA